MSSLRGGREFYEACLRWHTTTNMTAEEIFQTGLTEVDRIKGEMEKVIIELNQSILIMLFNVI